MGYRSKTVAGLLVLVWVSLGLVGCGLTPIVPPSPETTRNAVVEGSAVEPSSETAADPVVVTGFTDYERAAVRIRNVGCGGVSTGSGFAIADNVIVTNRHVIGGAAVIQVSTYDGHDIQVSTAGAAIVADLALVWTNEQLPATIHLAAANADVGTNVTAVGYPLGGPLTTTHGVVLGYASDLVGMSSLPMMVNNAPIDHGSSGSPLIDDSGQLVGVAYAGNGDQYAVPIEVLKQVLDNPQNYSNRASCQGIL